jgi:hypothetical protein
MTPASIGYLIHAIREEEWHDVGEVLAQGFQQPVRGRADLLSLSALRC